MIKIGRDVACNVSTMDMRISYLIHLNIFLVETSETLHATSLQWIYGYLI